MNKLDVIVVCIDDDRQLNDDPFFDDIRDDVNDIVFFDKPTSGLEYIKANVDKKIIVFLDWRFNNTGMQGDQALVDINEVSSCFPIIIFTGQSEINIGDTIKMFAGNAFSCIAKDSSMEQMRETLYRAYDRIKNDIRTIMIDWILGQPDDKRCKSYVRLGNVTYTLNDILTSIRKQDLLGQKTAQDILTLATELFLDKR